MATSENWEEFNNPELVEMIKKIDLETKDPDSFMAKFSKALKMPPDEPRNLHIKSTPLFELTCVEIFVSKDQYGGGANSDLCLEYYGHIQLIDESGNKVDLFKKQRRDAVPIIVNEQHDVFKIEKDNLGSPQLLSKSFLLKLHLKDRLRNLEIVNIDKLFNFTHDITYDKLFTESISVLNTNMSINVSYIIFQCGVIASLDVTLLKNGDGGIDEYANVRCPYFNVTYEVGNNYEPKPGYWFPINFPNCHARKLLQLAVPADALLVVRGWIEEKNGIKEVSKQFKIRDFSFQPVEEKIVGDEYSFLVRIAWMHAFHLLPKGFVPELCADEESSNEQEFLDCGESSTAKKRILRSKKRKQRMPQLIYSQPSCHLSNSKMWDSQRDELVELFSICVCSYSDYDALSSIYGTIKVTDSFKKVNIFNGMSNLHSRDTISLEQPNCCFVGPYFAISLDLKDANGREISRGYASICDITATGWYDRRLCCVVPGKDGFAAVHFTLFENAVQAKIRVVIKSFTGAVCRIHGSICARYSSYKYATHHDKKYYESKLFDVTKNEENGEPEFVLLCDGDEVVLSKSVVSVPLFASLIVKADIIVQVADTCEKLTGMAIFKAEKPLKKPKALKSPICKSLKSPKCELIVSVEWGLKTAS